MPVDGLSPSAVVLPALNFAYRTFQTGFELAAVPKQTQDLLDTISQVSADVKHAKALRRKKSRLLDHSEKQQIDMTIQNADKALDGLKALVEHPRVDMMTNADRIGMRSRLMWVMRDATSVPVALARLGVMAGALNREIMIMRLRQDTGLVGGDMLRGDSRAPPPPYQATRKTLYLRRQSMKKQPALPTSGLEPSSPMTEMGPRSSWTDGMGPAWSSASDFGAVISPVSHMESDRNSLVSQADSNVYLPSSQPHRNVPSPASQPESIALSPIPEVATSPVNTPSDRETAPRSRPRRLRRSERTIVQQFGSIEELVAARAVSPSWSEPAVMPSRLLSSSPRASKCDQPSDLGRIASPLALDDGGLRTRSVRNLRHSRSQSWLAFQASRATSPALSLVSGQ